MVELAPVVSGAGSVINVRTLRDEFQIKLESRCAARRCAKLRKDRRCVTRKLADVNMKKVCMSLVATVPEYEVDKRTSIRWATKKASPP